MDFQMPWYGIHGIRRRRQWLILEMMSERSSSIWRYLHGTESRKQDEVSDGDMMDAEDDGDPDPDAQLDSLRTRLIL
ncbi:hypothetical protein L1987_56899 [Smallanthus sonchifolius]|uniref:Uncharacterized protein n=1 Tax=Smallanthus sonchifolius TaxID=185202 RepID=A0ACB9DC09_9ASTR|nr:hypothetical protein L1987_56899 [Smallanthus sonchifolius]